MSTNRETLPEYLQIGRVIRPHGVRGDLVVESASDLLSSLEKGTTIYSGPEYNSWVIDSLRPHRGRLLLKLHGITSRNLAESLRNQKLFVHSEQVQPLPQGSYYYWQIVGLAVFDEEGAELGVIKSIIETGANDVYVIEDPSGKELLVPAIEDVICDVDLGNERMIIRLLPGLL